MSIIRELKTFLTEVASCLLCCLSIASVALVVGFSFAFVLRVLFRLVLLVSFSGVLENECISFFSQRCGSEVAFLSVAYNALWKYRTWTLFTQPNTFH
jgi:hypothetical protein